eukprot:3773543-Pleurochrysis_carterae.AAC.2
MTNSFGCTSSWCGGGSIGALVLGAAVELEGSAVLLIRLLTLLTPASLCEVCATVWGVAPCSAGGEEGGTGLASVASA